MLLFVLLLLSVVVVNDAAYSDGAGQHSAAPFSPATTAAASKLRPLERVHRQ
jgi:hypothetical protein